MASVLETFFILFESDADKASKEVDSLDKSLDSTAKTSEKSVKSSDKASDAFVKMGKSALGAVAGVFAIGKAISATLSLASEIDELGKFSAAIGENIEDIDAWGRAVEKSGGSSASFQQSISTLNRELTQIAATGTSRALPFFEQLGISVTDANGDLKSTLDLLPELADEFENLSAQEAQGFAQRIGLDQGTITLLQSGRREVEAVIARQKELGSVTQEAANISAEFNDSMSDLKSVFMLTGSSIITSILPPITKLIEKFTDISLWVKDNSDVVKTFFTILGAVITGVALPAMIKLAAATVAATWPFIAIGAAIAGVAVVIDDIIAFTKGYDSVLGDLIERFPILGKVIDFVVGIVRGFISDMSSMADFLFELFTAPTKALEKIIGIGKSIKSFFGFGGSDEDLILEAQKNIDVASSSGLGSVTSSSIQNSSSSASKNTSVSTGDIVINTQATSPDAIAADVSGALDEQLRITIDDFDDAVAL